MGKSRKTRCGRKKFGVRSEPRGSLGRGKDTARLASPDDIFPISPRFLPFPPTAEPGLRLHFLVHLHYRRYSIIVVIVTRGFF